MRPAEQVGAEQALYREARFLDEQDFAGWLDMLTDDIFYWMPAWTSETTQTADPDRELSLIYYRGKDNLRDRVKRLTSGQSVASRILPRVVHQVSNVMPTTDEDGSVTLRSSFHNSLYDPRSDRAESFFGHYEHRFVASGDRWRIASKVIRLANDKIPTVLDVNAI